MAMIHTLPNNGQTNDWLTPKWLHALLGEFDLDPVFSRAARYFKISGGKGILKDGGGVVGLR